MIGAYVTVAFTIGYVAAAIGPWVAVGAAIVLGAAIRAAEPLQR